MGFALCAGSTLIEYLGDRDLDDVGTDHRHVRLRGGVADHRAEQAVGGLAVLDDLVADALDDDGRDREADTDRAGRARRAA